MKRLLAAAALLTLALAGAASGGHERAAGTVSSTGLVNDGTIRVTLHLHTPVEVGHSLKGTFFVRNVSTVTQTLSQLDYRGPLGLVIHSPDGTRYDTQVAARFATVMGGPRPRPVTLEPGQTVTLPVWAIVRWSGPLRITPQWDGTALPSVRVSVATPGPAPSMETALADVIASTGHLLDGCTPTHPGVPTTGTIAAPNNSAPPLRVACKIGLRAERGFVRAQVLVVSPPGLRGVRVWDPYEHLSLLSRGRNATAVAWLFVVTQRGAMSLASQTVYAAKTAKGSFPEWWWTTSGFQPNPEHSSCVGLGSSGGAGGPIIEFVSKCR